MAVIVEDRLAVERRATPERWAWAAAWGGVLCISTFALWLAVKGAEYFGTLAGIWSAVSGARRTMVGPGLLAFVAVCLIAEQFWPAVPRRLWSRAQLVDGAYLALFAIVVVPVLTLVNNGFTSQVHQHASWLLLGRLPLVPRAVATVLILVGMDAMLWAAHVLNHRYRALWRLHALHHSQEDMSVLTTFRTHPLIHATYLPSLLPALVLQSSGSLPAWSLVVYGCLITLPHANLRLSFGPLDRVLVSPAFHRLHHARQLSPRGNLNYGFALSIWDQLAGCAELPSPGVAPVATGIEARTVPLEQIGASRLPRVFASQLVQPFRRYCSTDWPRG